MNVNRVQAQMQSQQAERTPKNQLGKNDFFQILAAQIKYQDPLSGSDQTQNIAQMAQFSSLEQMQNLNEAFSKLLFYQNAQYGSQLVGKRVTLDTAGGLQTGIVERVRILADQVSIIVGSKAYGLDQVIEIAEAKDSKELEIEVKQEENQA